jgi:DNA-binding transcriptional MerR regulator
MDPGLKIGELARRAGVTAKVIRFYETKRVLPPAPRGSNRYRLYGEDTVEMLSFIKQATGLGLTLAEIKEIIAIRPGRAAPVHPCAPSVEGQGRGARSQPERPARGPTTDPAEPHRMEDVPSPPRRGLRAHRGAGEIPTIEHCRHSREKAVKQVELRVSGMTCRACEQRIEKALTRIDGVVQTAADHGAAQVRVLFDPARTSESALRSCIERAGYSVTP